MYSDEIIHKPYMLDVDYLIFGYDMDDNGNVTIKDLWLKKVWQITRSMDGWAINLQVKKGVVHKIRPGVWYSINKKNMPMFECLEDFVSAIEETVYQNRQHGITHPYGKRNLRKLIKNTTTDRFPYPVGTKLHTNTKRNNPSTINP